MRENLKKGARAEAPTPLCSTVNRKDSYFAAATMASISSISSWVQIPSSIIC